MAKYRFPDSIIQGFSKISKLSDSQVETIVEYLNATEFGRDSDKVYEDLKSKPSLKKEKEESLVLVIKAIYSLLRFDDKSDESKKSRVSDLVESAIEQIADTKIKIIPEKLSHHLNLFYSISGRTKQTIKGFQLLHDNQKNLIDAKIVTDIRIVFDDDVNTTKVDNAVIVHNLKIEFNEDADIKELFISLDSNDVVLLKEVCSRAIKKEQILREKAGSVPIRFLSLEEKNNNS
ncbi:hypothetical protein LDL77_06370 [Flagellimonas marinaquae]|uniref:hypothetical protein n=1 Tax=Flagellimonas aurea TaxID=2915619 RepID=UPI001CE06374|nr:hypothetical protein LDL77_06370 [Allomuricauda aquimarina]